MQNINRMAHMKRTEFGKVDLDYVLGIGGFELERLVFLVDSLVSEFTLELSSQKSIFLIRLLIWIKSFRWFNIVCHIAVVTFGCFL